MERPSSRMPATRPVVLIVDGHDEMLAFYALALSAMGFDVVPASSNEDALSRASTTRPDIVVTQVSLRESDGWRFVHDLKVDPRTREIPVVVLSDQAASSVREWSDREECAAVLVQPCSPTRLALRVREVLSRDVCDEHASIRH